MEEIIKHMSLEIGPVLAFDPGGSLTGLCRMFEGEITYATAVCGSVLKNMLLTRDINMAASVWICEKFILYPAVASRIGFNDLEPAKLEGFIDAIAHIRGIKLVNQLAAEKESFLPYTKPFKHGNQHSRDAHAHILAFLLKESKTSDKFRVR